MEDSLGAAPPITRVPPSACSAEILCNSRHRKSGANENEACEHAVFMIVFSGVDFRNCSRGLTSKQDKALRQIVACRVPALLFIVDSTVLRLNVRSSGLS